MELTWDAPASDGGSAIQKYQYRRSADDGSSWTEHGLDWTDIAGATVRTYAAGSLTNGTAYTFEVRAVNAVGGGGAAQAGATPAGAPTAPQNLAAAPDDEQVELTWEAPADTGGFDIEKYQYRQSDDGGSSWNTDWTDIAGARRSAPTRRGA